MPNPEMSINGGIYQYTWGSGLTIKLDKIREDSRNGMSAEILVRYTHTSGHIHQVRYNLLSTRGRSDVAKFCLSRIPDQDWDAIIETVSIRTIEAWRSGEPVVKLGDVEVSEGLHYRLRPFLVEREANLIYGEGGLGKSMVSAFLATLVQEGIALRYMEPEPGQVLYLDYEATKEDQARRFRRIYAGLHLEVPVEVLHRFCYQPLSHDIQEIQRVVIDRNVQMVVVDSAGPACGGEPESAAAVIPFFTALRSLRITSLIIAHRAKNAVGVGPFGSVYWMNMPRNVFEIKKAQEQDSNVIHLLLRHIKANDSTLMRPTAVRMEFTPEAVSCHLEDATDVPEFSADAPLRDRITGVLHHGARTVRDLADELDEKEAVIRVTLNRRKDQFTHVGDRWGLLNNEG